MYYGNRRSIEVVGFIKKNGEKKNALNFGLAALLKVKRSMFTD